MTDRKAAMRTFNKVFKRCVLSLNVSNGTAIVGMVESLYCLECTKFYLFQNEDYTAKTVV